MFFSMIVSPVTPRTRKIFSSVTRPSGAMGTPLSGGLECCDFLRRDFAEEAGVGFAEEDDVVAGDFRRARDGQGVEVHAESAGERHFGGGDGDAAFGAVVAGADEAATRWRARAPRTRRGPARAGRSARGCRSGSPARSSASRPARRTSCRRRRGCRRLFFASMLTTLRTSRTMPTALMSSVGGIGMLSSPTRNSLLRLSLPLMNGVP